MSVTGARLLCQTLSELGVTDIFGLPGTQNIDLFEELRRSRLRTIVPTSELSAGFMANGYYRASGKVGVVTTIPGPGFTYILTALAEAAHDSAGVLYIVERPRAESAHRYGLQVLDQQAIAAPLAKRIIAVEQTRDLVAAVCEAYSACLEGEPGPVMLHIAREALEGRITAAGLDITQFSPRIAAPSDVAAAAERLRAAERPLIFAGQGAQGAALAVQALAEALNAPVVTTRSGRGVLPEDHVLSARFDASAEGADALNALAAQSDAILVLGCKFTQNGTLNFRLKLAPDRLIRVDASTDVLDANYPAAVRICADVPRFLDALMQASTFAPKAGLAAAFTRPEPAQRPEPLIGGASPSAFFTALRRAVPRGACLVTDTGMHQILTTRYFPVLSPRGYLLPTDYQSMGFGLPAAIGAKIANPERTVVAVIGDGSLLMCGPEIGTAVREHLALTIIVFNDRAYGQIRAYQHAKFGHSHGTTLGPLNIELFAKAFGARYALAEAGAEGTIRDAIQSNAVSVVEVRVSDSAALRLERIKGRARQAGRALAKSIGRGGPTGAGS